MVRVTVRLMLCWLQGLECVDVVTVQVAAMVPLRSLRFAVAFRATERKERVVEERRNRWWSKRKRKEAMATHPSRFD